MTKAPTAAADHDRERADRRGHHQLQGLLLALEEIAPAVDDGEYRDPRSAAAPPQRSPGRWLVLPSPTRRRTGSEVLFHDLLDHQYAEQEEIDRQDDEAPAAHPAAQLFTPTRRSSDGPYDRAEAGRRTTGVAVISAMLVSYAAAIGWSAAAIGSSAAVTWRNSSSRSLAAREKLTTGSPAATADASRRAVAASSPRKPSSIVLLVEQHGGRHVVVRQPVACVTSRASPSSSRRTRRTASNRSRFSISA